MSHDDYLKKLYVLQDLMCYWMSWRRDVSVYGIRHEICCDGMTKLTGFFEKTYRNYCAWCRRHKEENLFISYN